MTFLELVKRRRSVRRYARAPVSRQLLDKCLEAARLAPSACNSQPWHFIVVDDPQLKETLARAAFSGIYSINSFAKDAPAFVAAVRERSGSFATFGGGFRGVRYNLIDVAIACEHLILQAAEEGLGTCWLGWFNERAVKKILNIPRHKKVDVMISIGYPERPGEVIDKARKPLAEIREFNK